MTKIFWTLEKVQDFVKDREWTLLSDKYINTITNLLFRCKNNHEFWKSVNNLKIHPICKYCPDYKGRRIFWTLEKVQDFVKDREWILLSDKYIDSKTKLLFRCKNNHEFWKNVDELRAYSNCKYCPNNKGIRGIWNIQDIKKLVDKWEATLLSTAYKNAQTKLHIRCPNGHELWSRLESIKKQACRRCSSDKQKLTLETMQELALSLGGECLSETYISAKTKMKFKCNFGHIFETTPDQIRSKNIWCTKCKSKSIGEEICRLHFEELLKKQFPTIRPRWLLNKAGNRMELDGYCKELKLAFEFCGQQHYNFVKYYHKEEKKFQKTLENDKIKKDICMKHNITLIEVSYKIPI